MLTESQKLWIDALRSGEYTQKRGILCNDGRYCCLGVACELYIKHVDSQFPRQGKYGLVSYGNHQCHVLPREVREWLRLNTVAGDYNTSSLSKMNDHGATFGEIADLIESEPEGLFFQEETHAD